MAIVLNEELVKRGLQENDNVISDLNAILSTISGLEFPRNSSKLQGSVNELIGLVNNTTNEFNSIINKILGALNSLLTADKFAEKLNISLGTIKKDIPFNYSEIEKDGFMVQGFTIIDGKYYVSCYKPGVKKADFYNNSDNIQWTNQYCSRVYVYDENGKFMSTIILNNVDHVGGITYDTDNNIMIVTGSGGKISAYNYKLINDIFEMGGKEINLNSEHLNDISIKSTTNDIMEGTNKDQAATIYWYDGFLYSATYHGLENSDVIKVRIDFNEDKNIIEYNEVNRFNLPKQTQGIAVTEYDEKTYIVTTQSAGPLCDSQVNLYKYDNNETLTYVGGLYPKKTGLEGVKIDDSGNVICVSEYSNDSYKTTINHLINNVSKDLDPLNETVSTISGWTYENKDEIKDLTKEAFKTIVDTYEQTH